MKKLALITTALIVLAQLGWLSVQYDTFTREINASPTIWVRGEQLMGSVRPAILKTPVDPASPLLGKSLWWDKSFREALHTQVCNVGIPIIHNVGNRTHQTVGHITSPSHLPDNFPTRPMPGAEVQGALELGSECGGIFWCVGRSRLFGHALFSAPRRLAAFWKKGEDGLWSIQRLEAPGSSEDTPREGEQRGWAQLSMSPGWSRIYYIQKEDGSLSLCPIMWHITPLNQDSDDADTINYFLPESADRNALQAWRQLPPDIPTSIELVMRPKHPIFARRVFIDGKPYENVIKDMIAGKGGPLATKEAETTTCNKTATEPTTETPSPAAAATPEPPAQEPTEQETPAAPTAE